jgi:hypothetical protein
VITTEDDYDDEQSRRPRARTQSNPRVAGHATPDGCVAILFAVAVCLLIGAWCYRSAPREGIWFLFFYLFFAVGYTVGLLLAWILQLVGAFTDLIRYVVTGTTRKSILYIWYFLGVLFWPITILAALARSLPAFLEWLFTVRG